MIDRRTRLLSGGIVTAILQRAVGAAIPLASIPIALEHLGASSYGAWAAAVSFSAVFVISDLGVGAGLMTRLGALEIGESPKQARSYVSSAYALVTAMALLLAAGLIAAAVMFDLARTVGAPDDGTVETVIVTTLVGFLVNVPVSLVIKIQYAIGMQMSANVWQICSSISMFVAIVLAARYTSGSLWFVSAAAFVPVGVGLLNTLWLFVRNPRGRTVSPTLVGWDPKAARQFFALGFKFVVISGLLAFWIALDPWIVANTASLERVAEYSIPSRIFAVIGLLSVAMALPLWPLHAKSIRAGDVAWIRRITLQTTAITTGFVTVVCSAVALLAEDLVNVWLGGEIVVYPALWWGLALTTIAQAVAGPMFMLQNGAEVLIPQAVGYLLLLSLSPLKWEIAAEVGYQWIPFVNVFGYICVVGPACLYGYSRSLNLATANSLETVR